MRESGGMHFYIREQHETERLSYLRGVQRQEGPARSRDVMEASILFQVALQEGGFHAEQVTDGTQVQQGPVQHFVKVPIWGAHCSLHQPDSMSARHVVICLFHLATEFHCRPAGNAR